MRTDLPTAPVPASGPPEVLRLPPHCSLLERGPDARLIGLHPASALAVDGLSPPLAQMLDELAAPVARAGLVERAVARGASAAEAAELLARLVAAGAIVDAAGPERIAARRDEAVVVVTGDGPLAVGVVAALVLGGVGAVHYSGPGHPDRPDHDDGPDHRDAPDHSDAPDHRDGPDRHDPSVGPAGAGPAGFVRAADLGTGFLDADRGRFRADAVADVARRLMPGVRVREPPLRLVPDLVVLADAAAPDPVRVAQLVRDGVPHLPVRMRDGHGVVGPLVLPARSSCLGCVELHRTGLDPTWPVVAAQLANRTGLGDAVCAAATAALGAAQALAALDGTAAPPVLDTTLELDPVAGTLLRRAWPPHPACTCGAPRVTGVGCGPAQAGGTITR